MKMLCEKFIKMLLSYIDIKTDDEQIEVYVYGLLSFVYTFIPLIFLYIISVCCDTLMEIILWSILFTSFRKYAGGYHASHPITCFLCSILLGISCIVITKIHFYISYPIYLGILTIFLLIVIPFAPITKKEFTADTRMLCKMKLLALTITCTFIFTIFSTYQIILLHAVISTLILCIVKKYYK